MRLAHFAGRDHALLSLAFIVTRVGLHVAGLRFELIVDWMFLSDTADLRERLLSTLYYFHAYPPGMNLLTGLLLKLGGADITPLAQAAFWLFGLVLVNALYFVARGMGLSVRAAGLTAVLFSLTPTSLFFENLYLYDYPTAALLCLAAAFLCRALQSNGTAAWVGFFAACATIGFIRSTFHLLWFLAMVAFGAWFAAVGTRRRVLSCALVPGVLLFGLYEKNALVFGTFSASSALGSNLTLVTVARLPADVKTAWMHAGKLSPFAGVSAFAGPRAFLPYFPISEKPGLPAQLNRLDRPTLAAENFNHWSMLEVGKQRRSDATYYLSQRPLDYAGTVLQNLRDLFGPSTHWHPRDKRPEGPHAGHRALLGGYETFHDALMHRFPFAPVGLYLLLPLPLSWAVWRARALSRATERNKTSNVRAALHYFCVLQIVYVVLVSSAFSARESARYRYVMEPFVWLLVACCVKGPWPWLRRNAAMR